MGNTAVQSGGGGLRLRSNRPFLVLMGAQLVSNIGEWLYLLALLTMIGLKWKATPWEITAVSLCMAVPMLIGGPLAGVLSDRFNRKTIMIVSDLVRAGVVGVLVFAGSLWQVYALLLCKGVMDVLFSPAKSGKIKELVPQEQMDQAVAVSSSIEQITKIAGPAAGGLLVGAFGISACYVIDAGTFLASALLLLALPGGMGARSKKVPAAAEKETGKRSFRQDLAAGLRIVSGIPMVFGGLMTLVSALLVLQIADSQTVTLFRDIPGVSEDLLGWCVGASGLGTLISAVTAGKMGAGKRPLIFMGSGAVLMGLVFTLSGAATLLITNSVLIHGLLFGSFLLAGAGAGMIFVPFQSMLQQRTPAEYTGRVFGTVNSLTSAAVILGPVAGGALVTGYGPVAAFVISGMLAVLVGLSLLFMRSRIERRNVQPLGETAERIA